MDMHKTLRAVALLAITVGVATLTVGARAQVGLSTGTPPETAPRLTGQASEIFQRVRERASALAAAAYVAPDPPPASALPTSYDDYRKIVFKPDRARWRGSRSSFEVHLLPLGWLFKSPIRVWLVEDGTTTEVKATAADFADGRPDDGVAGDNRAMPLSGFRINWPLNEPTKTDEVIVFQGASYFRALAANQRYGLSMRALAIRTASQAGEEFPEFREFWIEKPQQSADAVRIYALLDSPSTSGAYAFTVRPGVSTTIDVEAVLYPRRELTEVGLAPLTSMFMVGPVDRGRLRDFRPRVHDSDGLAVLNHGGERLWRPLANPYQLQVSEFVDLGNRGFGLIQRERRFDRYEDLEARYDLRPSAWVEPLSEFGAGSVVLVEIPTELEIHDNIVAFWRPRTPLPAGKPYQYAYRLHVQNDALTRASGPFVVATRSGPSHFSKQGGDRQLFVIEYEHDGQRMDPGEFDVRTFASKGQIDNVVLQPNPISGGVRASFEFDPQGASVSELRLDLHATTEPNDGRAETWLYRWTKTDD